MKKLLLLCLLLSIGSLQFTLPEKGYYHAFSGTRFKDHYKELKFIGSRTYDDAGQDISVGYNLDYIMALTHYIYPPADGSLAIHFENYKRSLLTTKKNARLLDSGELSTEKVTGKYARFGFNEDFFGSNQPVYSYLFMFEYYGWYVMLRITTSENKNEEMEKEIANYLRRMPWPTKHFNKGSS